MYFIQTINKIDNKIENIQKNVENKPNSSILNPLDNKSSNYNGSDLYLCNINKNNNLNMESNLFIMNDNHIRRNQIEKKFESSIFKNLKEESEK